MAQLGLVLYHGIDNGLQLADYAQLAEAAGFASLWVTERYFHEETFSLLGFLAAATRTITLGVGVTNPYTRPCWLRAVPPWTASAAVALYSGSAVVIAT
jgi:5,10-methylenetetrahydromethanopterin reductase